MVLLPHSNIFADPIWYEIVRADTVAPTQTGFGRCRCFDEFTRCKIQVSKKVAIVTIGGRGINKSVGNQEMKGGEKKNFKEALTIGNGWVL